MHFALYLCLVSQKNDITKEKTDDLMMHMLQRLGTNGTDIQWR